MRYIWSVVRVYWNGSIRTSDSKVANSY